MSCCGGGRTRVTRTFEGPAFRAESFIGPPARSTVVVFRYVGTTRMTVYGEVTGRKYWFSEPGAEVAVDVRDRAFMHTVPNVREVRLG